MKEPEFWVSIGSTYSYLTVSRLPQIEAETGLFFDWRPFSVREIMIEMDNVPFATKPVKAAYMWRDIERRARLYGLRPQLPAPYPLQSFDLVNRVAVFARSQGWCREFVTRAYREWFEHGREPGSEDGLRDILEDLGRDATEVVQHANSAQVESDYRDATEEARKLGVFGAPTFVMEGEVFWGDDRLEDALSWVRKDGLIRSDAES